MSNLIASFTKHSQETYSVPIDYAKRLPVDAMPSSGVVAEAIDMHTGASVAGTVTGLVSVNGSIGAVAVTGGVDGKRYLVAVKTLLTNGNYLVDLFEMSIVDRPGF